MVYAVKTRWTARMVRDRTRFVIASKMNLRRLPNLHLPSIRLRHPHLRHRRLFGPRRLERKETCTAATTISAANASQTDHFGRRFIPLCPIIFGRLFCPCIADLTFSNARSSIWRTRSWDMPYSTASVSNSRINEAPEAGDALKRSRFTSIMITHSHYQAAMARSVERKR